MTASNTPNGVEQRRAKLAAMQAHLDHAKRDREALLNFDEQMKAWTQTVYHNAHVWIENRITGVDAVIKNLQAQIDAGV